MSKAVPKAVRWAFWIALGGLLAFVLALIGFVIYIYVYDIPIGS